MKYTLILIITIHLVVLEYIFYNLYTHITIYQYNVSASPEHIVFVFPQKSFWQTQDSCVLAAMG